MMPHSFLALVLSWLGVLLASPALASASLREQVHEEEDIYSLPVDEHLPGDLFPHHFHEIECTCDRPASCPNASSCGGARIFYLLGIHNNRTLNDALYVFRRIRDRRNTILIHIDKKLDMQIYEESRLKREIDACPCGSQVEVASVHNASWGSWSMMLPTLWGIERAVTDYAGKWDVLMSLSGDTLPVYKPDTVSALFDGPFRGVNFVTSSACETGLIPTPISYFPKKWHKWGHYSKHPMKLNFTDADGVAHRNFVLEIRFGSQWMSLLPDFCQYLTNELARNDSIATQFKNWLVDEEKLMTDETFIPTLLMHWFPDSIPKVRDDIFMDIQESAMEWDMYAIRYERMDEHGPSSKGLFVDLQHYDVPKSATALGVGVPHPWGPYYLGVYDLADIRTSGALFVRKVATAIDENMFSLLPVDSPEEIPFISWPNEVKLIEKPDWKKKIEEARKKYMEEKAKKEAQGDGAAVEPENEEVMDNDESSDSGDNAETTINSARGPGVEES